MKFIVTSTALYKQLQVLGGVLNSSNTLPILDNFLFQISDGKLTVSASDLESTVIASMDIEAKDEGSICVPAKTLLDTLKTFPEQPLTFTIDTESMGIEISSDYGKYKLPGYDSDEFPKVPEIEDPSEATVTAEVLTEAINRTSFATGNDDLRPVMSGILFEFSEEGLRFVATDAHKLVRYSRSDIKVDRPANFIVPRKPLGLLKNVLSTTNDEVHMQYNESNVRFAFENITLISRLIEGKYPNYEAVIPKDNPNKMTISRVPLLNSLRRVSIFSNKTTHQVRLKISGSELVVSAEDQEFANEAMERLDCSYDGEDIEIGFNSRFLIEMLNNLDNEDIIMELSAPNRAGILLPSNNETEGEDLLMLVMPVMLNN